MLSRLVGAVEARCAANREGEVFRPPGETEVANSTAVYEVEMVAEAFASGASRGAEGFVQRVAIKSVCLDANDCANDVRTVPEDGGVLRERVDNLHRAAVNAAKTCQRWEIQVQQDLCEQFCRELIELADDTVRCDGRVDASSIVKRTPCHQLRVVQSVVADVLLRIGRGIEYIRKLFFPLRFARYYALGVEV